jgi:hypothetical protein
LIVALDDVSMQEAGVDKHRAENGAALGSEGDEEDGASDEEGKAGQEWLDSFYRSPHLSQFLPFTSNHFSYDVCECMYIYTSDVLSRHQHQQLYLERITASSRPDVVAGIYLE